MSKKKEEIVEITGVEELPEDAEVVEEVVIDAPEEIVEEIVENIDLRGFKTLEDAKNYPNTPEFEKLDIGCRTEYQNWLKSITKED